MNNMPRKFTLADVMSGFDPLRPFVLADHALDRLWCDPAQDNGGGLIVTRSRAMVDLLTAQGFPAAGYQVVTGQMFAMQYEGRSPPPEWDRGKPLFILGEDLIGNSHSKTSRMARRWRGAGGALVCVGSRVPEPRKMFPVARTLFRGDVFGRSRWGHEAYHFQTRDWGRYLQVVGVRPDRERELYDAFGQLVDERFDPDLRKFLSPAAMGIEVQAEGTSRS
jgi:hypothetical protein